MSSLSHATDFQQPERRLPLGWCAIHGNIKKCYLCCKCKAHLSRNLEHTMFSVNVSFPRVSETSRVWKFCRDATSSVHRLGPIQLPCHAMSIPDQICSSFSDTYVLQQQWCYNVSMFAGRRLRSLLNGTGNARHLSQCVHNKNKRTKMLRAAKQLPSCSAVVSHRMLLTSCYPCCMESSVANFPFRYLGCIPINLHWYLVWHQTQGVFKIVTKWNPQPKSCRHKMYTVSAVALQNKTLWFRSTQRCNTVAKSRAKIIPFRKKHTLLLLVRT